MKLLQGLMVWPENSPEIKKIPFFTKRIHSYSPDFAIEVKEILMSKQEILEFINTNLMCSFATSEHNQPHVRVLGAYRADNKGIVFQTWKKKDLYKQIETNPFVEICFLNQEKNLQIRVKGKAVFNKDENLNNEIIEARPFIKPWIDEVGLDALIVFTVVDCKACVWDFEMNFTPKEYIQITE